MSSGKRTPAKPLTYDQKRKIEKSPKATKKSDPFLVDPNTVLMELDACQDRMLPLPFAILRHLVERHKLKSKDSVWEHWELFSTLLVDLGWNAALKKAADMTGLSEEVIKKDYAYVDKRLPPGLRREKTHKKRAKKKI